MAGAAGPAWLHAQLIDTVSDPFVTDNDSLNRKLTVRQGFEVVILKPELVSGSGVAVANGFDTYYIHVVKTQTVLVEGAPMTINDSLDTYVAVYSKLKRFQIEGDSIRSRALFLKAIVFGSGAKDQQAEFDSLSKRYRFQADSLDEFIKTAFMPEPWLLRRAEQLRRAAETAQITVQAYKEFRSAGKQGADVARFFLKHYLNQSDRYNIYTHPYGLPQITDAAEVDKKGNVIDPNVPATTKRKKKGFFRKLWDKVF